MTEAILVQDPRPRVDQVTGLNITRMPGGAILEATALPPRQGYWGSGLILEGVENGVLTFQFRAFPPSQATQVSTVASREVTVARFLSDQTLEDVRQIQVVGVRSSRSVRP